MRDTNQLTADEIEQLEQIMWMHKERGTPAVEEGDG